MLLSICVAMVRIRRISWTVSRIILVTLQAVCVARTGQIVIPFLYAKPKTYPHLVYSSPIRFLFIDISERTGNAHRDALKAFVDVEDPSLIVVTRFADSPIFNAVSDRFPARYLSHTSNGRVVEILSKLEPLGSTRLDYGYAALPAVEGEFLTTEGIPFFLGAFDLLPPYTQQDFLRSRLTSRRLASFLKFENTPRLVFGAFRTSVTSQIVDMYPGQLRLRALSFNSGISIVPDLVRQSVRFDKALHVFTARRIDVSRVVQSQADDGGFSSVLFDARIPKEIVSR